jgi:hypothetical protein
LRRFIALAALAFAACSGEAPVDMKDPASVARGFVAAYNVRDLARMLPLVDQVNLDAVKEALAGGPESEAYQGIFAPQMVDLLAREAGKVEGPRYDGSNAIVSVGKTEDGDVYTIELGQRDDGEWLIEAFPMMSQQDFMELRDEPRPKR